MEKTLKWYTLRIKESLHEDAVTSIEMQRGFHQLTGESQRKFLNPSLDDLYDPFLLPDMGKAVERILAAREKQERVVVFGDYDVDGVSSTALLVRFFHGLGMTVSYRLPHRVHDGYGFKPHFIQDLADKQVKLVVTVDCGTKDTATIKLAKEHGIDVIVTDHHVAPDVIPEEAVAIINPKRKDSAYPFPHLAWSWVAFKLLSAISSRVHDPKEHQRTLASYVDFACLGTIADCMPIVDENRIISILGLATLRKSRSHGLRKLIESEGEITADTVGFRIGPRINAAGRMDTPYTALKVLLAGEDRVDELLEELEWLNAKRKTSVEYFVREALLSSDPDASVLFYHSDKIEHGIIGLIAGRLLEAYNRPAIAMKNEGEHSVGSCRSPEYYDITAALEHFRDMFVAFGGHRQAAGFTIRTEDVPRFQKELAAHVRKGVEVTQVERFIDADCIVDPRELNDHFLRRIERLKPFGIGNRKPVLVLKDFAVGSIEDLGKDGKHLKLSSPGIAYKLNAFSFGEYKQALRTAQSIDVVFEMERNFFRGRKEIVLNVKDFVIR